MPIPLLFDIIAAIIGAVGAAFGAHKAYKKWAKTRAVKRHTNALEATQAIGDTLETLIEEVGADRALLLKCANGGGLPSPGKARYSTVMFEAHKPEHLAVRHLWQQVLIDQHYSGMMLEVYQYEGLVLDPTKLPDSSLLKPIYIASGVEKSIVLFVGATKQEIYYLSVNLSHHHDLDQLHWALLRQAVQNCYQALSEFDIFVRKPGVFPLERLLNAESQS